MSITFAQVKAKLAADAAREAARLARRRGYDAAGRARRKAAKLLAEGGLQDLPALVAAAVKQAPAPATPEPPKPVDATVEELVARLVAIRERIFRLRASFAVTLSSDNAMEANRYVALFQTIAAELEAKDPEALANITRGFESLLLSPPFPTRGTIPLDTQKLVELRWEVSRSPARKLPTSQPDGYVPDGLQGWV